MSDSKPQDSFAHGRGTLASLAGRKRWRLFDRSDTDEEAEVAPEPDETLLQGSSMLRSLASRKGKEPGEEPSERRSLLALEGSRGDEVSSDEPVSPLVAHSTLGALAGLEERSPRPFPIERGILVSLLVHALLIVFLISVPARLPSASKGDLFAALVEQRERDNSPIPVVFQEAPGPARQNPKKSVLSDADRRVGGGDRSRPKSDTPFVPPSPGVAGLAPGPRAPRVPGSEVEARRGATAQAERRAAPATESAQAKPSDFPSASSVRPETSIGPRETAKLAGLDSAIREAARGTIGGEGGSPLPNPGGGFVDSGPISFDTTWYDWGPYAAEMVRRIKLHWDVPELARLGWKGKLTVRFFILADGRVADAKILRGSGIPPFDFAAFQAIIKSNPFRPLPTDLHEDREGVTVTFFYNLRPESEEGQETK